jgi:hypothetical protein
MVAKKWCIVDGGLKESGEKTVLYSIAPVENGDSKILLYAQSLLSGYLFE